MKTLILIRGLPGSGKTTLAEMIPNAFRVAADDYPGIYIEGVYQAEKQKESHEWCRLQFESAIADGYETVIVHNTFTKIQFMQPYAEFALKSGYSVHVIHSEVVTLSTTNKKAQSVHNVPQSVVEKMAEGN